MRYDECKMLHMFCQSYSLTYITLLASIEKDAIGSNNPSLTSCWIFITWNINRNILPDKVCEKWGNDDILLNIKKCHCESVRCAIL